MAKSKNISRIFSLTSESTDLLRDLIRNGGLSDIDAFGKVAQDKPANIQKIFGPNLRILKWNEFGRDNRVDLRTTAGKNIYWFATICNIYPSLISKHENLRNQVEQAYMRGDFDRVHLLLDEHETHLGKSLWCYQWRILSYSASSSEIQMSQYRDKVVEESDDTLANPIINLLSYLTSIGTPPRILRRNLNEYLSRSDQGAITDFLRVFLLDEIHGELTDERLRDLINSLELLPLPDRYSAFLRIATHVLSSDQRWEREITRGLQVLAAYGTDARIIIEKHHFGTVSSQLSGKFFDSIDCWDKYFKGDYREVGPLVELRQESIPYDLNLLDLKIKSDLYLNRNIDGDDTPEKWLGNTLCKILRDNDIGDRVYDELDRYALASTFYSLGAQITAFIHSYSGKGTSAEVLKIANLRGYHFSPRHNESLASVSSWRAQLDLLSSKNPTSASVRFLRRLISAKDSSDFLEAPLTSDIPEIRQKYFRGLIALKLGFLPSALKSISEFIEDCQNDSIHGSVRFALDQALILRAEVYRLMGDADSAQRVLVDLQIEGTAALKRVNLQNYYALSHSHRKSLAGSIDTPILAWLAKVDPHDICLSIKRFLKYWNVSLPSELLTRSAEIHSEKFKEFIFRVCVAENIDSISRLDTSDKVEQERLSLLRWISENYEGLANQVEREKLNLIQVSQLREGLDRIDDNKLVIDLASLQEVERHNLEEIFQDYSARKELALSTLAEKIQKLLKEVGRTKAIIVDQQGLMDAYKDAYFAAFDRLRRVFIRSPQFGFEGCLSGRIRHGIVVEHLLKPIKLHSLLITDRTRELHGANMLDLGISYASEDQQHAALEVLTTLTNNIATEARLFRDEVIQTSLNQKDLRPAFNYHFSDEIFEEAYLADEELSDWQSFSSRAFSYLVERTRECLPPLRQYIENELKNNMSAFFDVAIKEVEKIGVLQVLRSKLVKAKQDMDDSCDDMLRWFQELTGAIGQDVNLNFAVNTAIGMLERLHPEFQRRYSINVATDVQLKGQFFTSFVHMIFFLVENGVKHTDSGISVFSGAVSLKEEGDCLCLTVSSKMSSAEKAAEASNKIAQRVTEINIDLDPDSVIKEKGSGFAKIMATLRFEFKSRKYEIVSRYQDDWVVVEVLMTSNGIAA